MKRLLILLALIPTLLIGQIPGDPDANGTITPGPPWVTGITTGGGESELQFEYLQGGIDSSKAAFNYEDSSAFVRYIDWDLRNGFDIEEGRTGWDTLDKVPRTGLSGGSSLQHGLELLLRGVNKTGSTLDNGTPIYVSGAQGNRPKFAPADNSDIAKALTTIGLATQEILDSRNGYGAVYGEVRGINTSYWPVGTLLWLGPVDSLQATQPDPGLISVAMGIVIVSNDEDGVILVKPVVVPRLAYLSDVNARGNQENNHLLQWNADSLFWESKDSLAIGAVYYTDTYWDDLRVPLTNTRINPVNTEPDFEDRGDGMFAWGFDSDSDSSYVLNFIAQTPHQRKDSSVIEAHIHWQPDGTNTGAVVWKLIYSVANIESGWTTTDTLRIVDNGDGVALKQQIIDFGEIEGSDTLRISSIIIGNIGRMGEAPDDTYTGTAYGIELDFHYQIDAPGSREEYIK